MSFPPDDPPFAAEEQASAPDERDRKAKLRELDAALARGLADADAGRVKPLDEVAARLTAKYQAMADAKLEALRQNIREGLDSGPTEPHDMAAIKAEARTLSEQRRESKLRALDAALARGLADAEAGRVKPLHEAFARIRAKLGVNDFQKDEI